MTLVGDSERNHAVAQLRRSYAQGRLTLDELSLRTGEALAARTRADLRRALRELPGWWAAGIGSADALHALPWPLIARSTATFVRAAVFAVLWTTASIFLLVALLATLLVGGLSAGAAGAFALAWAFVTWALWRGFARRRV
jgi:hypothetical protein